MNLKDNTLTFVIPWYGNELMGGAETLCKRTAENLKDKINVEIFTTCSKEFLSDWSNFYTEGKYDVNDVTVKRFKVDPRNIPLFDSINYKLINKISLSREEEQIFIKNNINSSTMMDAIKSEKDRRIYAFIPYLYGTTYFGCQISPEKSVMIPCLHDESYAYMSIFRETLPKMRGMIFNSRAEKFLAERIYSNIPSNIVIGSGIDGNLVSNPSHFRHKFELDKFMLYAGRKDPGKNVNLLIDYYCTYCDKNGIKFDLVLTGPGKIEIPSTYGNHIRSLMLSKEDLYDGYSAAIVTCQPSVMESFSLSILESWLSSTPVLVHGNCDVTRDHCIQSNGGLYFTNYEEFEECMNFFINNVAERNFMAKKGKEYVLENFAWSKIVEKYLNFLSSLP